jgi:mannose-6-phosphate isomerase-like protein (cupin superfamily)
MLTKDVAAIEPFQAGDRTLLREILHPERDPVEIGYSLAHALLRPGETSLRHTLTTVEVYYFTTGTGRMHVGGEPSEVSQGVTVVVPAGAVQWLENTGPSDLTFLCIVYPAWQSADEQVLEGP